MSISASDKGMRPGVCTSTNRPANPYDGMVIYETDTDKAMVWNSSAWVVLSTGRANPGGLDFISSTPITAANSVSVNNCFTSTYENYRIMFSPSSHSTTTQILLRLRLSGTDSSTNYMTERAGGQGSGAFANQDVYGTTAMTIGYMATTNGTPALTTDLYSPALARPTVALGITGFADTTNGHSVMNWWNSHTLSNAYDGFTIYAGSSATMTGNIYLYGYAK